MSEFHKLLEQTQSLERAERQLKEVKRQLETGYRTLLEFQKSMDKEYADVEKLEKGSLADIFYKVLGDKEQQLEQERQEYLQAVLQHEAQKKSLDLLEFEQTILEEKIAKNVSLHAKKEYYLLQRAKELQQLQTPLGKELHQIEKELEQQIYLFREIREALSVSATCIQLLLQMQQHLQAAHNWGHWNLGRGNQLTNSIKHTRMDNARHLIHKTKHELTKLEKELEDIYGKGQIKLSFKQNTFKHFTTAFFDNLITDWIVQQKIYHSLSSTNATKDHVIRIATTLQSQQAQTEEKINALEEKKRELVLESL